MTLPTTSEYLFLVISMREDDGPPRIEAAFEQLRDSLPCTPKVTRLVSVLILRSTRDETPLTLRYEKRLVVACASAPDVLAVVMRREGRVGPPIVSRFRGRYDVVVRHPTSL